MAALANASNILNPVILREAVLNLIDYATIAAEDKYEGDVTFDRILEFLNPIPDAIKEEMAQRPHLWFTEEAIIRVNDAVKVAKIAIAVTKIDNVTYQINMQQLRRIANQQSEYGTRATKFSNRKQVLSDIRRAWRKLGGEEARRHVPLYELVTGRELINV
ncbi:MAG: hypothetical protein Q9166_007385 [cf. Caloplaca sp. 2 TL-2023]